MNTETKGRAIIDFEKIILNVNEVAFNEGEKSGRKKAEKDILESMEREFEKSNTEYCVTQFESCKTLEDFQTKLTEITNRSYNFMT